MCRERLGGPEFCEEVLQPNYMFGTNVSPGINVVLYDAPAPILHWRITDGANVVAAHKSIKSYTYEYLIFLPNLTKKQKDQVDKS